MQTDRLRSQNVADSMQTDRLRLRSQNVANSVWKEMENGKREGEEPKRPPEPQKPHKPGAKSHKARIEKRKKIHPAKKIRKKMLSLCNYAPVLEASMQVSWGSMPWSENCQAAHLIECVLCEGTAR